jgi:CDP-glycerol glycerophosphotransferase (TagB/SpsB family)
MAYSDVFTTVYSTMVVEAAIHRRPIISVCIDQAGGWKTRRKYSLALSKIGNWPTHQRFIESGAGKVAFTRAQLIESLNHYLQDDQADKTARQQFIKQECTHVDGTAAKLTAGYFLDIIKQDSANHPDRYVPER